MRTPIRLPCQGGVAQRKAEGLPSTIRLQVIKKDHPKRVAFLFVQFLYMVLEHQVDVL